MPALKEKGMADSDFIEEIEKSLMLWASDHGPEDALFHGGIADPEDPTDEELDMAWTNHREMLAREPGSLSEIVFRHPTWDHVPDDQGRWAKPSRGLSHTGLPNPPFVHIRYIDWKPEIVLKSNWEGPVEGGSFRSRPPPERITPRLAEMLMKMVEEDIRRPNWAGYTPREDFVGAAQIALLEGAMKYSPLKSPHPKAYIRRVIDTSFKRTVTRLKEGEWMHERKFESMDYATEDGLDIAAGKSEEMETWRQASDREFDEAEREWKGGM